MDYKKIHLDKISFSKFITYDNAKLIINTPIMKTINGIEKDGYKYILKLEFDHNNHDHKLFYELIKNIENKISSNYKHTHKFISLIKNNILYLKIPFRYKRFEINIMSEKYFLPTSCDIKPNLNLKCNIHIIKSWNINNEINNDNLLGLLIEVKDIYIL